MAHQQLVVDKNHSLHQYPSPDTHPVSPARATATPAPPSPPLSSASSPSTLLSPTLLQHSASLPPSVREAFRVLQDSQRGEYDGPSWVKFPNVLPSDLDALVSAAESILIYKLRYDYDPTHELLILRMSEGQPHVFVKNGMQQAIWEHVKERLDLAIREQGPYAAALRSIRTAITPLVEAKTTLPDGSRKRPDVSFYFAGTKFPPLVVEVGHSQKSEELPALARKFIESTDGDIRTVVTVDLGYRDRVKRAMNRRLQREQEQEPGRRVTRSRSRRRHLQAALPSSLSLFRLGNIVLQDQPFRDERGQALDGGFELNVADFVPLGLADELVPRDVLEALTFSVPFSGLSDVLTQGEELQALEERTPTPQPEAQSRKRVHFSWSLPEVAAETEGPGQSSDSEPSSTSKRHRTAVGDKLNRGRAVSGSAGSAAGGSSAGGSGGGARKVQLWSLPRSFPTGRGQRLGRNSSRGMYRIM